ncbi:retrotransposon protein, putative, ty1-copia subclass [Tanacetum coccineum]
MSPKRHQLDKEASRRRHITTEGGKPITMNLKSSTDHRTRDMVYRQYHTRLGGLDEVNTTILKGRSIWDVSEDKKASWGWNNLLAMRDRVRAHFKFCIGNRKKTMMWHDHLIGCEEITKTINHRVVYEGKLDTNATVVEMYDDGKWLWPDGWLQRFLILQSTYNLSPDSNKDYKVVWITRIEKCSFLLAGFAITSVVVVRPVNTRHRWDETCLLDIIVIKSTDVVGMALPVQNINHSAFRSMFDKEKLSGNNFNDWFARLKLVLRVKKKMHVIKQPLPPAPKPVFEPNVVAEWTALYDAHTEIYCLMLRTGVEKFDLIQSFHACKQEEGKPVADHVLKMKGYVERLERLSYVLPQDITVGLIFNGLTKDFVRFVRNYNMHKMGKTIGEIHAMLIEYEKGLPKKAETLQVIMIKNGKIQKANKKSLKAKGKNKVEGKGKDKKVYIPKPTALERPAKDDSCHHCKEGLKIERKLKQGALYLYVGNGVREQVEAIGSYDLVLPNGLVVCLDNCHYAPTITRGVVLVSRLVNNGFVQCFMDYGISISKNNVLNKRVKRNLDSTYLWHCRLAHINKKRIKQLQQDGLLKSTDDESFDKCESCLSGKMTKKPFPHSNERAKDLLGIIHTDVCGPLRHVSRQESATRILNMVPTKKVDKTPYELWYEKVLNLSYLKVSGCEALVKRDTPDKLEKSSVKCIFIGYLKEMMGYDFYFPPENKIVVARYAEFFEKCLINQEISGRVVDLEEIQEKEDTTPSEITSNISQEVEGFEPPQPLHEEEIPIRRSERTRRAPNRLCLNVEVEEHSLGDLNEPNSYKAAMLDSESNKWIDAMNAEIQSMMDNMVWVMVDLPPGCKTVGSSWNFKKKTDMDETFSPIADIRAIRILISIAAYYDYEIWKMDVKTTFLNGYLDEDIYMDLGDATFILGIKIYRDRSKRLIGLSQNSYMDKILKRYKMDNSIRGYILMQERLDLNKSQGAQTPKEVNFMKNIPYASDVRSIMYAVRCTRPDVAFAQNMTSRFQQNPGELHWTAVKNILKYLRNTKDMFLVYGGNPSTELRVECYCDARFEIDIDDTKSKTGYVFVLNGGAVDWKSSKQSTIAMSATESEYIVTSEAAMEAVWIRKFILGLGVQKSARHYPRRYHYVRECVELGEIRILKVHIDNNLDDPFTKALSNRKLTQHARSMRLRRASSFM